MEVSHKKSSCLCLMFAFGLVNNVFSQLPSSIVKSSGQKIQSTAAKRCFLSPVRILWQTPEAGTRIINPESLLKPGNSQADLTTKDILMMRSNEQGKPGILLDYGIELQGGLQLVTGSAAARVRLRFGESAA